METNLTSSFSGFQFTTSRISIIHSQVAAWQLQVAFFWNFHVLFLCVYAFLFDFELVIEVNWWWWLCDADVRDGGEGDGVPGRAFQPVSDEPSSCCTTTSPPPGWGLWDQIACEIRSLVDAMNCGYCRQIWGWGKKTRSNFSLVWSLELQDKVRSIPISLPLFLCLQMPLN